MPDVYKIIDLLRDLADVDRGSIADADVLQWDASAQRFVGVPMSGGPSGADANYVHTQVGAASVWTVMHNLHKYPSITVIDSGGSEVVGDVVHDSVDQATLTFSVAFSGKAIAN